MESHTSVAASVKEFIYLSCALDDLVAVQGPNTCTTRQMRYEHSNQRLLHLICKKKKTLIGFKTVLCIIHLLYVLALVCQQNCRFL